MLRLEFMESNKNVDKSNLWFLIEKRDSNRITWVKVAKIKADNALKAENGAIYYDLNDLTPGVSYYFRVSAESSDVLSKACELQEPIIIRKKTELPSKPLKLEIVKSKTRNSITLQWVAPMWDGNEKLTNFHIEEWTDKNKIWKQTAEVDASITSFKVENLIEDTKYKYRVIAVNRIGSSQPSLESEEVVFKKIVYAYKI